MQAALLPESPPGLGRDDVHRLTGAGDGAPKRYPASSGGAALRKWALTLNGALAGRGVHAGHVAIGAWIAGTPGAPEGAPLIEPDDIARRYWELHTSRGPAELVISAG